MDPYIEKAKADLAGVEQEISALHAQLSVLTTKKKKLTDFIALYSDDPSPPQQKISSISDGLVATLQRVSDWAALREQGAGATAKDRITSAVYAILSDGIPRHTRTLLDILRTDWDLEPGSTDKVIGLSNLLSRDDRFQADRAIGWSLKKETP